MRPATRHLIPRGKPDLGFSFLEIIFVMVLLVILAAVVAPRWYNIHDHAEQATEAYVLSAIQEGLRIYEAAGHIQ